MVHAFRSILLSILLFFAGHAAFGQASGVSVGDFESVDFGNSNWAVSYFNFSSTDVGAVKAGGNSWNIYQYLAWNRRLGPDQRLSLRAAFDTQTAGFANGGDQVRQMDTKLGDAHFTYSDYSLAHFQGEWDLSATSYLYLPTSQTSQDKRWSTRLASWLIFSNVLNRHWLLTYNMKPEYYFNTQRSYRQTGEATYPDATLPYPARAVNNMRGQLQHYVELTRYLNRYFSPQASVGFTHAEYEDSAQSNINPASVNTFDLSLSSWVTINNKLRFIVGVQDQVDLAKNAASTRSLFHDRDMEYYVMSFLSVD